MTRINANIQPVDLIDQHLIAEYREIIRIPNVINKKGYVIKAYPQSFRLSTGHVLYFYNKIKFLHKRFLALKAEMNNRKINNNIDDSPFLPFINNTQLYNDIHDHELIEGNKLIVERILSNMSTMKREPLYYGKPLETDFIQTFKNKY